ncbi:hypothetical protein FPV67DRAFT_927421 [Lyophyllum atratum]|nr:hypothetical protein FPV67DRAFT_927421 [Lyophyllum atratum]
MGPLIPPPLDPQTVESTLASVVLGGATSVGQFVIQWSLGATHVVDRRLSFASLAAEVAKTTPASIEIVYDAVSVPETQEAGYSILADGGHLLLVTPATVKATRGKGITSVLSIWTLPYTRELGVRFTSYYVCEISLNEGILQPNRVEVLSGGLRGIAGGLDRLRADLVSGVKLVVRPQETK